MTIINGALLRDMETRLRRGETYKQLADRTGLAVGTVYHRLYRAGSAESGGAKVGHGSGGIVRPRAE